MSNDNLSLDQELESARESLPNTLLNKITGSYELIRSRLPKIDLPDEEFRAYVLREATSLYTYIRVDEGQTDIDPEGFIERLIGEISALLNFQSNVQDEWKSSWSNPNQA